MIKLILTLSSNSMGGNPIWFARVGIFVHSFSFRDHESTCILTHLIAKNKERSQATLAHN